ncbi:ABC transporter permease [Pantoea ananatis]|jgi:hypothetical protein|nr:ABC transporter permease [Pantoea ananatis]MDC7867283.1 ABC transporter permease [Pantoea ananatis]MDQ1226584.1 hypothetical protein [Pantoea ananatis]MDR6088462.1 hypothetical protein [Pantoea ananatis]PQK78443.1 ABC transporter permease [Pantoea ananatis]
MALTPVQLIRVVITLWFLSAKLCVEMKNSLQPFA